MAKFNLPESKPLRSFCMAGCKDITSVLVHDSNYVNKNFIPPDAFAGCDNLAGFETDVGSLLLTSYSCLLMSNDLKTIIAAAPAATSIHLKEEMLDYPSRDFSPAQLFAQCKRLKEFVHDGEGSGGQYGIREGNLVRYTVTGTSISETLIYVPNAATTCTLTKKISDIDIPSFDNCTLLDTFTVDEGNAVYTADSGLLLKYNTESQSDATATLVKVPNAATSITIPAYVTAIDADAFNHCTNLQSISVAPENESLKVQDGMIMSADGTIIFHAPNTITTLTIPENVREIKDSAFFGCNNLASVVIPSNVTIIGANAFGGCGNITDVTISQRVCNSTLATIFPDSYTKITKVRFSGTITKFGTRLFADCTALFDISIPTTLKTLSAGTFARCQSLTSANVPGTVKEIGTGVFSDCSSLNSVTLNVGTTSLASRTFENCSSLSQVVLPSSLVSIGQNAFFGCMSLQEIILPENISSIGNYAFANCHNLSFEIPIGVRAIGTGAFAGCILLPSTLVLNDVESIGADAFNGCTNLKTVAISNPTAIVGDEASLRSPFIGCTSITTVTIPADCIVSTPNGATWHTMQSTFPDAYDKITTVSIVAGANKVGFRAFAGCSALVSVMLPDTVLSLEQEAFDGCENLPAIQLPNGLKTIARFAFRGCDSITSMTIPSTATSVVFGGPQHLNSIIIEDGNTAYSSDSSHQYVMSADGTSLKFAVPTLTSVSIPLSVTSIPSIPAQSPFYSNKNITTVEITPVLAALQQNANNRYYHQSPLANIFSSSYKTLTRIIIAPTVKSLGPYCFASLPSLSTIEFHDAFMTLGNNAFEGCIAIQNISLPVSILSIPPGCFLGCTRLSEISFSASLTSIGDSAFEGCISLTSLNFPSTCTTYGNAALKGCVALEALSLPNTTTSIPNSFAEGCESLSNFQLPTRITKIGSRALFGCSSIPSFSITNLVTQIGTAAFAYTTAIFSVVAESQNYKSSAEGNLYTKDGNTIIRCNVIASNALTDVSVIDNYAFAGLMSLVSLEIPQSVVSIKSKAFEGCRALVSIAFTESGNSCNLSDGIFDGCSSLTSITFGRVTLIPKDAFKNNTSLTSVSINHATVGESAFENCIGLNTLIAPYGIQQIQKSGFKGCSALHIAAPNSSIYGEGAFQNSGIIAFNIGYTSSVGDSAFADCESLTSATILSPSFPLTALTNSSHITSLTTRGHYKRDEILPIGNELQLLTLVKYSSSTDLEDDRYVKIKAWEQSEALKSLEVQSGVVQLLQDAFAKCSVLESISLPTSIEFIHSTTFAECGSVKTLVFPLLLKRNRWSDAPLHDGSQPTGVWGWYGNEYYNSFWNKASIEPYKNAYTVKRLLPNSFSHVLHITMIGSSDMTVAQNDFNVYGNPRDYFEGCSATTDITFGPQIVALELFSFADCVSLTKLTLCAPTVVPVIDSSYLPVSAKTNLMLYVPPSLVSAYQNSGWNQLVKGISALVS